MLWVIRAADNVFLRDKGGEDLITGESAVTVTRVPDARVERYDSGQASGIRAATAQEIADYTTVTAQRIAQSEIDAWPIMMKALVLALIDQLNVLRTHPAIGLPAVTPAQALAAIRAKAGTL